MKYYVEATTISEIEKTNFLFRFNNENGNYERFDPKTNKFIINHDVGRKLWDGSIDVEQIDEATAKKVIESLITLEKAYNLAFTYHKGQVDKANKPYINHVVYVANHVNSHNEKIVAILHDIVEDTSLTLNDLKELGFSNIVIEAIDAITKRKGEDYQDYLKRVMNNKIAIKVKIEDLKHNSDITRFDNPTIENINKCNEYKKKLEFVKNSIK